MSPGVAYIKTLHEDMQTLHREIEALKKKLDKFLKTHERQLQEISERLRKLDKSSAGPAQEPPEQGKPPSDIPPTPFQ